MYRLVYRTWKRFWSCLFCISTCFGWVFQAKDKLSQFSGWSSCIICIQNVITGPTGQSQPSLCAQSAPRTAPVAIRPDTRWQYDSSKPWRLHHPSSPLFCNQAQFLSEWKLQPASLMECQEKAALCLPVWNTQQSLNNTLPSCWKRRKKLQRSCVLESVLSSLPETVINSPRSLQHCSLLTGRMTSGLFPRKDFVLLVLK